jgi:leucyl-tRNA synthetase
VRRTWTLFTDNVKGGNPTPETLRGLRRKVHQTLKRVTRNFDQFEFNTIVSSLMELLNEMYKARENGAAGSKEWNEAIDIYLRMMAPVAPHIAEELWAEYGKPYSIHTQSWPKVDEEAAKEDEISIAVQVNGKVRDHVTVAADADDETVKAAALATEGVVKSLAGATPKKVIVVKGKLVSIVM